MYEGFGADDMPTAPYNLPGSAPGGSGPRGSGSGGPGNSGSGSGGWGNGGPGGRGGWSRGKRAAALLAVCAVVGGGAFAATEVATSSPATAQSANTQSVQAGTSASVTAQASTLREALGATGIRRLARLRRLGGIYGQYTFETASGPRTLAFERGTIVTVGGGDVVVRAADGTTWTWTLTGTSVVREDGTREPQSALAQGQTVFAGGQVSGGSKDAWLIVIRKAAGTTAETEGTA
jgi:hypothetical protein